MLHYHDQHVLVVDDDPQLREMFTIILEENGYSVSTAADGLEALTSLRREPPAAVVSDINMPVMNGRDLLISVRREFRSTKVILISGEPCDTDELEILGALSFLRKPVRLAGLMKNIHRVVENEKRSTARLKTPLPVTVPGGGRLRTLDISGDGMLIAGGTGLEPGTTAPFTVHGPGNARNVTMDAEVMRLDRQQETSVTAVRFTDNIGLRLLGCLRG